MVCHERWSVSLGTFFYFHEGMVFQFHEGQFLSDVNLMTHIIITIRVGLSRGVIFLRGWSLYKSNEGWSF